MSSLIIRARFERLYDRRELRDWATRGVYINLGGNPVATARVGEGWVDTRAAAAWRRPTERLIACDLGGNLRAKRDAQIVEWLILEEYRWRMGRLPRRNYQAGKSSVVAKSLSRRDTLRVHISGCNPLNGRPGRKIIVAVERDDHGFVWDWN